MKIEQQVVSLELARELKELKVKQESLWYWSRIATGNGKKGQITKAKLLPSWEIQPELTERDGVYRYSAFTVAELGEMLPEKKSKGEGSWIYKRDGSWICAYLGKNKKRDKSIKADTEANARAKMLIYLIEKKLIEI